MDAKQLFPYKPILHFYSNVPVCPNCQRPLGVLKTKRRTVTTFHIGSFNARETVLHCSDCTIGPFRSEKLASLVPPGYRFGYDSITFVGQAKLIKKRSSEEIIEELNHHNITISNSEVRKLIVRYIVSLGLVHLEASPKIAQHLQLNGGYILHLDSTSRRGSRKLLTGMDEISGFVLLSVSLPHEGTNEILTFIKTMIERYGQPLGVVSDMASAIRSACSGPELRCIPHYICHFHAGKDLLDAAYGCFARLLSKHNFEAKTKA